MRRAHPYPDRASLWFQHRITECPNEFFQAVGADTYLFLGDHPGLCGMVPNMQGVGLCSAPTGSARNADNRKGTQTPPGLSTCPSQNHSALVLLPSGYGGQCPGKVQRLPQHTELEDPHIWGSSKSKCCTYLSLLGQTLREEL